MAYYRTPNANYYRPSLFGGFQFFPKVIKYLLIGNTAIFFLTLLLERMWVGSANVGYLVRDLFALSPLGHGFQPWQLISYQFLHGSLLHLLFNMFSLWMFGLELENFWGAKRFFIYYLVCGVGAGLVHLLIGPSFAPAAQTVGASGAIYGVLVAFAMLFPNQPIFVYFFLPIRAKYFVMIYAGLDLFFGVTGSPDGVAHFAHLGGAAVGLVYVLALQGRIKLPRIDRRPQELAPTEEFNRKFSMDHRNISDASYDELHEGRDEDPDQQRIDAILDKISQRGYQSLTDDEKKFLFEASRKLN
jgi:membrane associated rhomboid family serine protease